MFFKKKAASPEHIYEVMREFKRLEAAGEDDPFVKYGLEHFEEIPEPTRKLFLLAVYEDMKEKTGQIPAEEFAAGRLKFFSEDVAYKIKDEIWGGVIERMKNGKWKTGRTDAPI